MLAKTVNAISRSTTDMIHGGVDKVRGLTWSETADLLRFARQRLTEERLPQVASSLTFTTTLALVPLLTIVLAVFTHFPLFGSFRAGLDAYFVQTVMPRAIADTIIGYLTQFSSHATRLSAVGAVALVLTSAATMGTIERAFNQIWRVRQARPLAQRVVIYWALITLGPLLVGMSLTLTTRLVMATSDIAGALPFVGALTYTVVSVALTAGAFTLLYMAVPNRHVDWRDAVWGGLAAAIAFEVAKRGFGVFIRQFPSYSILYGTLAALPLFLLWLYLSWMIALVGALLTAALPVVKYERWRHQPAPGGAFVDAMAILGVLLDCARRTETAMVSNAAIRARIRMGYDEMTDLLERMLAEGWVGRVQAGPNLRAKWGKGGRGNADNWVLLANVDVLRLADVYRLFVFGAEAAGAEEPSPVAQDGAALARTVERAVEQGLDQSLGAYFTALRP